MSECCDNQKKPASNFRKLLHERIEKANLRRNLTAEETKRLAKLEAIADNNLKTRFKVLHSFSVAITLSHIAISGYVIIQLYSS